jgi:protein phosphatase
MEIGCSTDVGRERELNEDTVVAERLGGGLENPWRLSAVLAVADGMGGHQGGEVASQRAGEMAQRLFAARHDDLDPADLSGQKLLQRLKEALQSINRTVYQEGAGAGPSRPGTTLTVCLVRPGEYCIGHVGDSRAYLLRHSSVEQITEDDSWVAEAVRRGKMTREEAQNSPFVNQLTKCIGIAPEVEPSLYYGNWNEGDILLLCSDGLTGYVLPEEMRQAVQAHETLQESCDSLVALANDRGGHDNISVVAARLAGNGPVKKKPPTLSPELRLDVASAAHEERQSARAGRFASEESGPTTEKKRMALLQPRLEALLAVILACLIGIAGLWLGRSWGGRRQPLPKPASSGAIPIHAMPPKAHAPSRLEKPSPRKPGTAPRPTGPVKSSSRALTPGDGRPLLHPPPDNLPVPPREKAALSGAASATLRWEKGRRLALAPGPGFRVVESKKSAYPVEAQNDSLLVQLNPPNKTLQRLGRGEALFLLKDSHERETAGRSVNGEVTFGGLRPLESYRLVYRDPRGGKDLTLVNCRFAPPRGHEENRSRLGRVKSRVERLGKRIRSEAQRQFSDSRPAEKENENDGTVDR